MQIFTEMHEWSKKPFSPDMDLGSWIAFIGLLLVITVLWTQVIRFIIN